FWLLNPLTDADRMTEDSEAVCRAGFILQFYITVRIRALAAIKPHRYSETRGRSACASIHFSPLWGLAHFTLSGGHARHCDRLTGEVKGAPDLKRTTPSEVEQKLLPPVLLPAGVPTITNSLQRRCLQTAVSLKRNPDFVHHVSAVQLSFPRVGSMRLAWFGDWAPPPGSGPRVARPDKQRHT